MVGARPGSVARVTEHTFHGRQVVPDGEEGILVSLKSQLRMQIEFHVPKDILINGGNLTTFPFLFQCIFVLIMDAGRWTLNTYFPQKA